MLHLVDVAPGVCVARTLPLQHIRIKLVRWHRALPQLLVFRNTRVQVHDSVDVAVDALLEMLLVDEGGVLGQQSEEVAPVALED